MSPRLSKSRILDAAQCQKLLWLRARSPGASELIPDARTQALFDAGDEVGRLAHNEFRTGHLVEIDHTNPEAAISTTRQLLEQGTAPIFEAAFSAEGVFVAVDILEPSPAGWIINEVKATTKPKDQHPLDLAVQVHVLRASGVEVAGARLMHLNRDCRYPDLGNLFVKVDMMTLVEAELPRIPRLIERLKKVLAGPEPEVEPGSHCRRPYPCPFVDRCEGALPEHHISELYRLHESKRDWLSRGKVSTIPEIPLAFPLTATQARQRRAIVEGRLIVEPELGSALVHRIGGPSSFLDFETVTFPVPRWEGCWPWQQVPVQFSVHREAAGCTLEHVDYLATGSGDPRPGLARALVEAVPREGPVYVYNQSFERQRLRELAVAVPAFADELLGIDRRLIDLLPVVRNHIYHVGFGGSFSLKATVPVLCQGLGWGGLGVRSGDDAAVQLQRVLFEAERMSEGELEERRTALLRYCERDTYVMIELLWTLWALAMLAIR